MQKITSIFLRYRLFFHLGGILFALVPLIIANFRPHYNITYNPGEHNSRFYSIDDKEHQGGQSGISHMSVTNNQLITECYLKDGSAFPYAGIGCNFVDKNNGYINLSGFDYIKLRISSSRETNLCLELKGKIQKSTNGAVSYEKRRLSSNILVKKGTAVYTIKLEDITIPRWWINSNPGLTIGKNDVSRTLERIEKMGILHMKYDTYEGWEEKTTFIYHDMGFYKSNVLFYCLSGLLLALYLLFAAFIIIGAKKEKQKGITVNPWNNSEVLNDHSRNAWTGTDPGNGQPGIENDSEAVLHYKQLDLPDYRDNELKKIYAIISEQYNETDFSIQTVYEATGISPRKISRLLKTENKMSFKQFINNLRIREAKRLLLETDRNITDIAYKVGYNNLSNFYRVFKEVEHTAPGDLKKSRR